MAEQGARNQMRGRLGTRSLALSNSRAVGGPIAFGLFAAYAGASLLGLLAAALILVVASSSLASGDVGAAPVVLAVHVLALGSLPLAVSAASFHLLPVMLRNDIAHPLRLKLALPSLLGAFVLAPGLAYNKSAFVWAGAGFVAVAVALILGELVGLLVRAPADRTLVASRVGVALVCLHVTAAFILGAVVFSHGDAPLGGVVHGRWLLVHLHLAALGWLALLVVTVGRTLAPMLAQAPTASPRRLPLSELTVAGGLWLLVAGLAASLQGLALAGAAAVVVALGLFARQMALVARRRRAGLEAPLAHILVGGVFLAQAAVLGLLLLSNTVSGDRAVAAYVVFLLVGWAGGVTIGHLGKLLSLSLWVWWPAGPRPKQAELYPRRLWLAEAGFFALGVELVAAGTLSRSSAVVTAGASLLVAAALSALTGATLSWRARPFRR